MAQAVSRQPPTAEARFRPRVSPCGICVGQSGTGTGFPEYFGFPLLVSFHQCSITWKNWKNYMVAVYQSTRCNVSEDLNLPGAANWFPFCVSVLQVTNIFLGFIATTRYYLQVWIWITEVEGEAMSDAWLTTVCEVNLCLYAWLTSFLFLRNGSSVALWLSNCVHT
jgi:hypothetical protein